jgi:hypothetical protein
MDFRGARKLRLDAVTANRIAELKSHNPENPSIIAILQGCQNGRRERIFIDEGLLRVSNTANPKWLGLVKGRSAP